MIQPNQPLPQPPLVATQPVAQQEKGWLAEGILEFGNQTARFFNALHAIAMGIVKPLAENAWRALGLVSRYFISSAIVALGTFFGMWAAYAGYSTYVQGFLENNKDMARMASFVAVIAPTVVGFVILRMGMKREGWIRYTWYISYVLAAWLFLLGTVPIFSPFALMFRFPVYSLVAPVFAVICIITGLASGAKFMKDKSTFMGIS